MPSTMSQKLRCSRVRCFKMFKPAKLQYIMTRVLQSGVPAHYCYMQSLICNDYSFMIEILRINSFKFKFNLHKPFGNMANIAFLDHILANDDRIKL